MRAIGSLSVFPAGGTPSRPPMPTGMATSILIIGNQGLNNPFQASVREPLTLYARDFDSNGIDDPVLSYYVSDTAYPVYARDDLLDQLPYLKKRFPEYHDYAACVSMADIFGDKPQTRQRRIGLDNWLPYISIIPGQGTFELRAITAQTCQLSPIYAICAAKDLNHDGSPDLLAFAATMRGAGSNSAATGRITGLV